MTTVFVGPAPAIDEPLEEWLARRRALGLDTKDEVWEGAYHVAPSEHSRNSRLSHVLVGLLAPSAHAAGLVSTGPFNLGQRDDCRVPDLGYHRPPDWQVYLPTAAVVVEILSPRDESYEKLPFYAAHGVEEVWMLDAGSRLVEIRCLVDGAYQQTDVSALMGVTAAAVVRGLDWP